MKVQKRDGSLEDVKFDKVTARLRKLAEGLDVSCELVAQKTLSEIQDGISTSKIDEISADVAVAMTQKPDYAVLAARILVSNMHKNCGKAHDRDYLFDYFGLKTLQKMYLAPGETPQDLFVRVARQVASAEDFDATYQALSTKKYIHATPTLFNSETPRPQLASCFLVAMKDDSIEGIYDTKKEMAMISKYAGGIGLHIHNIRAKGSRILGNNGRSDGLIPMLRTVNADARYVNQGGRRKGAVAVYLEPWHADIMDFLELRLNQGDEESRCRDLFTALWIPDLFMHRLESSPDATWSLFCPNEAPGLSDVYGDEFDELYERYEAEGRARAKVPIQTIWKAILKSQVETGTPYMLYKDSCNRKSNQKNIGTIKSSNLCSEIIEVSTPDETAVCNLASIALPSFVDCDSEFNFFELERVTRLVVRNLNNVIDRGFYPVEEARKSNMKLRPIGIGVQGLADVFAILKMPFDSPEARKLNREIFEHIYFAALSESNALAKKHGVYQGFWGSPASQGILQFDMWSGVELSIKHWNWLTEEIKQFGLRNSLLLAPMPTATTSQILGFNECFEPFTSNMYLRRTLAGEFTVINKYLVKDLRERGLWNPPMKDAIIRNGGSVQGIPGVPPDLKMLYRTVWEIPQKAIIDMARDRGAFIDQSQSMNLFVEDPTNAKLSSMHMYAWKQGLKTGMYYLRTRPKAKPIQFSLEPECTMCSA